MQKINIGNKDNELISVLTLHLGKKMNKARITFMGLFICALCRVQTVNYDKLSQAFNNNRHSNSNLRRIQRFIASFNLDQDLVTKLIFVLLPDKTNIVLSVDRTNWKFGASDINILMLGVTYKNVAFPLMFKMLDKRGNSNTDERIELMDKFIKLFGKECIDCLVADREFVGDRWLEYLNNESIRYYIRIRNNFKVFLPRKNKTMKVSWIFNRCKMGEFYQYPHIVKIGSQLVYLSGTKVIEKDHGISFLILVSYNDPIDSKKYYKMRWQIETCFRAMKTSGFDIEKTHVIDMERLERLIALVMIAFVWCYKVGIHLDENVRQIAIKKHGRREVSIFKYGLKHIANALLNNCELAHFRKIALFLSCT